MPYAHSRFQLRIESGPSIEFGTGGVPAGADPDSCGYTRSAGAVVYRTDTGDQYVFDGTNWDQQLNADSTFSDAADTYDDAVFSVVAPVAQTDTYVHAAYASGVSVNFPGPFTNPDKPRNVKCVFTALWDGGDITIDGTDWDDNALQEVIADNPGATVLGTKVFKTVTAATCELLGAGGVSCSIGVGALLGVPSTMSAGGSVQFGGLDEDVTWSLGAGKVGFTPTNLPDGATDYDVRYLKAGSASTVTATP